MKLCIMHLIMVENNSALLKGIDTTAKKGYCDIEDEKLAYKQHYYQIIGGMMNLIRCMK